MGSRTAQKSNGAGERFGWQARQVQEPAEREQLLWRDHAVVERRARLHADDQAVELVRPGNAAA